MVRGRLGCWASNSVRTNDSEHLPPAEFFCDSNAQIRDLVKDATAGGSQISTGSNAFMQSALVPVPKAVPVAQIEERALQATQKVLPVLG